MAEVRCRVSVSMDGYMAPPDEVEAAAARAGAGALVVGHRSFEPERWEGDSRLALPVFVLTDRGREPVEMDGGMPIHFVTEGVESAVARAREAAGEKHVSVGGGATTIRRCLAAGLLDELRVRMIPSVLGGGQRLAEAGVAASLELVELAPGSDGADLTYRVAPA